MSKKCFFVTLFLSLTTIGLLLFTHYEVYKSRKLVEDIEYMDSLNTYNKIYYESTFDKLKSENKSLYDSLKCYKDKITYIVQFTHKKEYGTGVVHTKPNVIDSIVYDTVSVTVPQIAKTYEYLNEPNDTFQYKLNVNSYTEPNWYSLNVTTKNKFTIVNKEEGGTNHITIEPNAGGDIEGVTVFKKRDKRKFLERFSIGPSVTAGYDLTNKQWGVMTGISLTFDLNK